MGRRGKVLRLGAKADITVPGVADNDSTLNRPDPETRVEIAARKLALTLDQVSESSYY